MNEKYKVSYDYRKRTKGGFIDAIFLVSIILTAFAWLMMIIAMSVR